MGFFSWKTQDTDTSIANAHSNRATFKVQMIDNNGNVWTENNYDGYGVFGGKDFYELLAEMNGVVERDKVQLQGEAYTDYMRNKGIDLAFSKGNSSGVGTEGVYYPNLIEQARGWVYDMFGPDYCENQGYFFSEEEEEEEEYYYEEDENF
jgi:hypothetical protein